MYALKLLQNSFTHRTVLLKTASAISLSLAVLGCSQTNSTAHAQMNTVAQSKINTQTEKTANVKMNASASNNSDSQVVKQLSMNLQKSNVEATVISAEPIGDSGLYWVKTADTPSFVTTANGKYVLQGEMIEVGADKPVDVLSKFENTATKNKLEAVKTEDMIIFKANPKKFPTPKAVLYAFTDHTCHYCRIFHDNIDKINDLGIEVRYLAWPRHPKELATAESIWCSEDRNQAMTNAKKDIMPKKATCNSPVVDQVQLGNSLGIQGTPAIFSAEGEQLGGYLSPEQLVEVLDLK